MRSILKNFFHTPVAHTWLTVWIIIYMLIIILGLLTPSNDFLTIIKLSGIILCFVYALTTYPKDHLLHVAMFTTCLADLILAARNTSEAGIMVFFITQAIHFIRLAGERAKRPITIFTSIFIVCILFDLWLKIIPLIFIVSAFYATALLSNVYIGWRWRQRQPQNWHASCAFFGFLLFTCCDLCTVMSYFSLTHVLPAAFYAIANFLAWFFYYPSQILVSNSSKYAIMNSKEGKC